MTGLSQEKGTYVLVLRCLSAGRLRVGRLGMMELKEGFYLYVGSALGPGGLRARLKRHLGRSSRRHWHIDYLRAVTEPEEVWYGRGTLRREHEWAGIVGAAEGAETPAPGFGASDCRCKTHLFYFRRKPKVRELGHVYCLSVGGPDR